MIIHYASVTETYTFRKENRVSYGVVAFYEPEENGTLSIIASVRDVSSDLCKVKQFVKSCNDNNLSPAALCEEAEAFFG